jgi:transcriptional regulator with XRE-family HTH domain
MKPFALRDAVKKADLTVDELAAATGISRRSLFALLALESATPEDRINPTWDHLYRLATVIGSALNKKPKAMLLAFFKDDLDDMAAELKKQ